MYGVPLPCIGVRPSPLTVMAVTNDARSGTAWRAVSGLRANKKGSHGHRYDQNDDSNHETKSSTPWIM